MELRDFKKYIKHQAIGRRELEETIVKSNFELLEIFKKLDDSYMRKIVSSFDRKLDSMGKIARNFSMCDQLVHDIEAYKCSVTKRLEELSDDKNDSAFRKQ